MTALLASVRSHDEAFDAAQAGAEIIDLKEPDEGALGGVPVDEIARIVLALRAHYPVKPISATIGDVPAEALDDIAARVIRVSDAGVDYVKVGVTPGPAARRCLSHLACLPAAVVPVLLSDAGIDAGLVDYAAGLGFAGVVFDTASKNGRTLFDCVDMPTLAHCLGLIGAHGAMTGVAGSLGWAQLGQIHALAPDFAGFRTALCDEGRGARLSAKNVAQWAEALHHAPHEAHATQVFAMAARTGGSGTAG